MAGQLVPHSHHPLGPDSLASPDPFALVPRGSRERGIGEEEEEEAGGRTASWEAEGELPVMPEEEEERGGGAEEEEEEEGEKEEATTTGPAPDPGTAAMCSETAPPAAESPPSLPDGDRETSAEGPEVGEDEAAPGEGSSLQGTRPPPPPPPSWLPEADPGPGPLEEGCPLGADQGDGDASEGEESQRNTLEATLMELLEEIAVGELSAKQGPPMGSPESPAPAEEAGERGETEEDRETRADIPPAPPAFPVEWMQGIVEEVESAVEEEAELRAPDSGPLPAQTPRSPGGPPLGMEETLGEAETVLEREAGGTGVLALPWIDGLLQEEPGAEPEPGDPSGEGGVGVPATPPPGSAGPEGTTPPAGVRQGGPDAREDAMVTPSDPAPPAPVRRKAGRPRKNPKVPPPRAASEGAGVNPQEARVPAWRGGASGTPPPHKRSRSLPPRGGAEPESEAATEAESVDEPGVQRRRKVGRPRKSSGERIMRIGSLGELGIRDLAPEPRLAGLWGPDPQSRPSCEKDHWKKRGKANRVSPTPDEQGDAGIGPEEESRSGLLPPGPPVGPPAGGQQWKKARGRSRALEVMEYSGSPAGEQPRRKAGRPRKSPARDVSAFDFRGDAVTERKPPGMAAEAPDGLQPRKAGRPRKAFQEGKKRTREILREEAQMSEAVAGYRVEHHRDGPAQRRGTWEGGVPEREARSVRGHFRKRRRKRRVSRAAPGELAGGSSPGGEESEEHDSAGTPETLPRKHGRYWRTGSPVKEEETAEEGGDEEERGLVGAGAAGRQVTGKRKVGRPRKRARPPKTQEPGPRGAGAGDAVFPNHVASPERPAQPRGAEVKKEEESPGLAPRSPENCRGPNRTPAADQSSDSGADLAASRDASPRHMGPRLGSAGERPPNPWGSRPPLADEQHPGSAVTARRKAGRPRKNAAKADTVELGRRVRNGAAGDSSPGFPNEAMPQEVPWAGWGDKQPRKVGRPRKTVGASEEVEPKEEGRREAVASVGDVTEQQFLSRSQGRVPPADDAAPAAGNVHRKGRWPQRSAQEGEGGPEGDDASSPELPNRAVHRKGRRSWKAGPLPDAGQLSAEDGQEEASRDLPEELSKTTRQELLLAIQGASHSDGSPERQLRKAGRPRRSERGAEVRGTDPSSVQEEQSRDLPILPGEEAASGAQGVEFTAKAKRRVGRPRKTPLQSSPPTQFAEERGRDTGPAGLASPADTRRAGTQYGDDAGEVPASHHLAKRGRKRREEADSDPAVPETAGHPADPSVSHPGTLTKQRRRAGRPPKKRGRGRTRWENGAPAPTAGTAAEDPLLETGKDLPSRTPRPLPGDHMEVGVDPLEKGGRELDPPTGLSPSLPEDEEPSAGPYAFLSTAKLPRKAGRPPKRQWRWKRQKVTEEQSEEWRPVENSPRPPEAGTGAEEVAEDVSAPWATRGSAPGGAGGRTTEESDQGEADVPPSGILSQSTSMEPEGQHQTQADDSQPEESEPLNVERGKEEVAGMGEVSERGEQALDRAAPTTPSPPPGIHWQASSCGRAKTELIAPALPREGEEEEEGLMESAQEGAGKGVPDRSLDPEGKAKPSDPAEQGKGQARGVRVLDALDVDVVTAEAKVADSGEEAGTGEGDHLQDVQTKAGQERVDQQQTSMELKSGQPGVMPADPGPEKTKQELVSRAPGQPGVMPADPGLEKTEQELVSRAPGQPGEMPADPGPEKTEQELVSRAPGQPGEMPADPGPEKTEQELVSRAPGQPGEMSADHQQEKTEQELSIKEPEAVQVGKMSGQEKTEQKLSSRGPDVVQPGKMPAEPGQEKTVQEPISREPPPIQPGKMPAEPGQEKTVQEPISREPPPIQPGEMPTEPGQEETDQERTSRGPDTAHAPELAAVAEGEGVTQQSRASQTGPEPLETLGRKGGRSRKGQRRSQQVPAVQWVLRSRDGRNQAQMGLGQQEAKVAAPQAADPESGPRLTPRPQELAGPVPEPRHLTAPLPDDGTAADSAVTVETQAESVDTDEPAELQPETPASPLEAVIEVEDASSVSSNPAAGPPRERGLSGSGAVKAEREEVPATDSEQPSTDPDPDLEPDQTPHRSSPGECILLGEATSPDRAAGPKRGVRERKGGEDKGEEGEDVAENAREESTESLSTSSVPLTHRKPPRPSRLLGKTPVECQYCGRYFRHISPYIIHLRVHTGEKPYSCQVCGKSFAQLSNLNSHRRLHEAARLFPCAHCGRRFQHQEGLRFHLRVHAQTPEGQQPAPPGEGKEGTSATGAGEAPAVSDPPSEGDKPFVCHECGKSFRYAGPLQIHMRVHSGERPYSCSVCGKAFSQISSLNTHEKTHWPVKPYACSICGRGFTQLGALKAHSRTHTGEKPFSCADCGQAFTQLASLRAHQASQVCWGEGGGAGAQGESAPRWPGLPLQGERAEEPGEPLSCEFCGKTFRCQGPYEAHLRSHSGARPYHCEDCGKQFAQVSGLEAHRRSHDKGEVGPGQQQPPPHRSPPASQPLQPQHPPLSWKNGTPSSSPGFPQTSPRSPAERRTCYVIHPDLLGRGPREHECPVCGRLFGHPGRLRAHMLTHARGSTFVCGRCGKTLPDWNKYWLHQRVHHRRSRGRFSCADCGRAFRFPGSYRDHLREHAGAREASLRARRRPEKAYSCSLCGKGFDHPGNLDRHKLIHRGARPHRCARCGQAFPHLSSLQEHERTHARAPLYQCGECDAGFKALDLLFRHQLCHASSDDRQPWRNGEIVGRGAAAAAAAAAAPELPPPPPPPPPPSPQPQPSPRPRPRSLYVAPHPDDLYVYPSASVPVPQVHEVPRSPRRQPSHRNSAYPYGPAGPSAPARHPSPHPGLQEWRRSDPPPPVQGRHTFLPQPPSSRAPPSRGPSPAKLAPPPGAGSTVRVAPPKRPQAPAQPPPTRPPPRSSERSQAAVAPAKPGGAAPQDEERGESFECAECGAEFHSVPELYEHYLRHARGQL